MVGKRSLTKPTFGVVVATGLAVSVPAGQIIEIPVAVIEGNRTVDVIWNRQKVMMFVSDLKERSQSING